MTVFWRHSQLGTSAIEICVYVVRQFSLVSLALSGSGPKRQLSQIDVLCVGPSHRVGLAARVSSGIDIRIGTHSAFDEDTASGAHNKLNSI